MKLLILKNGQTLGPYTLQELKDRLLRCEIEMDESLKIVESGRITSLRNLLRDESASSDIEVKELSPEEKAALVEAQEKERKDEDAKNWGCLFLGVLVIAIYFICKI